MTHCQYKHELWEIFLITNAGHKIQIIIQMTFTFSWEVRGCDGDEEIVRSSGAPAGSVFQARVVHYDYQTSIWALRNYDSGVYDMEISINMIGPY